MELTKLKLQLQTFKSDLAAANLKLKTDTSAKKLDQLKREHTTAKELLNLKLKSREDGLDHYKKINQDLTSRNKDLLKKIDTVEKEFRSFTQKHSLLVTKQQGQLSLQKTKNSDKCPEQQEKTATKADNFLRLQEQMRSAACVGSYHHSNQYSDMGSTFQDAFVTQSPPP